MLFHSPQASQRPDHFECDAPQEVQDFLVPAIGQYYEGREQVEGLAADFTDDNAPAAVVEATRDAFGPPQIVVTNSGGPPGMPAVAAVLRLASSATAIATRCSFGWLTVVSACIRTFSVAPGPYSGSGTFSSKDFEPSTGSSASSESQYQ